jgi:peptidoglycan hydrolase-like protein with peptidoglycan-binding domain
MRVYHIDREEEAIAEVQRYLRALSYRHESIPHVGVDGIYNDETREAVRAFQALFALLETGVADRETFERLYRESLTVPRRGER